MSLKARINLTVQGKSVKAGDSFECSCAGTSAMLLSRRWAEKAAAPKKAKKKQASAPPAEDPATTD